MLKEDYTLSKAFSAFKRNSFTLLSKSMGVEMFKYTALVFRRSPSANKNKLLGNRRHELGHYQISDKGDQSKMEVDPGRRNP